MKKSTVKRGLALLMAAFMLMTTVWSDVSMTVLAEEATLITDEVSEDINQATDDLVVSEDAAAETAVDIDAEETVGNDLSNSVDAKEDTEDEVSEEDAEAEVCLAAENGEVLHFTFDDTETGFTSNGYTAEFGAGSATFSDSIYEKAAVGSKSLNLTNNAYLKVKNENGESPLNGLNEATISYYSKSSGTPGWSLYAAKDDQKPAGWSNEYYLGILDQPSSISVERYYQSRANNRSCTANVADLSNEWRHVVITVDNSSLKLYVDGSLVSAGTNSNLASLSEILGDASIFQIGKAQWGAEYYTGLIDEFSVFNYAMTAAEVAILAGVEESDDDAEKTEGTQLVHYTFADIADANTDKVSLNSVSNGAVIPNTASTGSKYDAQLIGNGAMLRTDSLVLPGSGSNEDNWALQSRANAAYVKIPSEMFVDEDGKVMDTLTINFWAQNQSKAGDWSTFYMGTKAENNTGSVTPTNYLLINTKKNSSFKAVVTHAAEATSSPWSNEDGMTAGGTNNTWQMYTLVVTPTGMRTYLNGSLVSMANHSMKMSAWKDSKGAAPEIVSYLGRSEYINDNLWSGAIKEFSAYDYALSEEAISGLYKELIPDQDKSPVVTAVSYDKSVLTDNSKTVKEGSSYELPEKTTVTLSDNTQLEAYITWTDANGNEVTDVSALGAGTYELTGKVTSYFKEPFIAESADPHVLYDAESKMYYFTCSDPAYGSINNGYNKISLRASSTLEGLADAEPIVIWDAKDSSKNLYGKQHIWAPEIHRIGGKWYVYFAGTIDSGAWSIRPRVLVCDGDDPVTGNWTEHERFKDKNGGYTGFNGMSLDMTYFEANGKNYVIWADIEPKSMLKIAEVDPADPTHCISDQLIIAYPEYSWERVNEIVNEGAGVLKKDGKIYVTFSGSGTGPEYCVGLLTADENADLLDIRSWSKRTTPILQSSDLYQQYGPGHNSFTKDANGNDIIVYHARDQKCYTDKCAYASSNSLYDPCRHAMLAYVRYDENGAPIFYSTSNKELATIANDTMSMTLTVKGKATAANVSESLIAGFDFNNSYTVGTNAVATANGTPSLKIRKGSNTALYLDGNSSYLDITAEDGTSLLTGNDELTISYWSKSENTGSNCGWTVYASPYSKAPDYWSDETYIGVIDLKNSINVERYYQHRSKTGSGSMNTGSISGDEWRKVDLVFAATSMKVYVNGELKAEKNNDNFVSLSTLLGENSVLQLGKANWEKGEYYKGYIDDLKIYSAAFDADTVSELYAEEIANVDADAEAVEAAYEQLTIDTVIYGNIGLVKKGANDTNIVWTSSNKEVITDTAASDGDMYQGGVVTRGTKDVEVTLTARITKGDSQKNKIFTVTVKALPENLDTDYSAGYLWTFFKAQGGYEKIYIGYSEDGLNWITLNDNKPLLVNDGENSDLGVRDPHIIRSSTGDKYWIIGTDLHAEGGGAGGSGWNQATASKNLVVWESTDLVNWSDAQIVFSGFDTAGCVWAPEAIWDADTQDYLVYYSVRDQKYNGTNDYALRVYTTHTRDFKSFTTPKLWLSEDPTSSTEVNIIDSTLVYDDNASMYYRFSTSDWNTIIDCSQTLAEDTFDVNVNATASADGNWTRLVNRSGASAAGFDAREGFTVYQLPDGRWCAMGDKSGYVPFVTNDISSGNWTKLTSGYSFDERFRHGTVLRLSAAEEAALLEAYGPKEEEEPGQSEVEDKKILVSLNFDDAKTGFASENGKAMGTYSLVDSYSEQAGKAVKFTASNKQFLTITAADGDPLLTGVDEMTVSYDIKLDASNKTNWAMFANVDANSPKYPQEHYVALFNEYTNLNVQRYNNTNGRPDSATAAIGSEWTHVDVVFTETNTIIYVNGSKVSSKTSEYKLTDILKNESVLYLGKATWAGGEYASLTMDNFQIANYAFTAEEVKAQASAFMAGQDVVSNVTVGTAPNHDTAVSYRGGDDHTSVLTKVDKETKTITSYVRNDQDITACPVTFDLTDADATITVAGKAFENGSKVDLSKSAAVIITSNGKSENWVLKTPVLCNNTVLNGQYADPDIDYFDGKFWIYPTTDGFSGWSGYQFRAFSSEDLVNWTDEGIIVDLKANGTYLNDNGVEVCVPTWAKGGSAWAPTIEKKNGKYYFYYCGKLSNGTSCIGVAVADSPAGPYTDLGQPLIQVADVKAAGCSIGQAIDPSIFTEDDGTSYILFGNGSGAGVIAQLSDDMMSIVPAANGKKFTQITGLTGFRESVVVTKVNGKYHWTWSVDDANSPNYHVNYAMTDSLFNENGTCSVSNVKQNFLYKNEDLQILGCAHQSMVTITDVNGVDHTYMAYHRFYTPTGIFSSSDGLGVHRETCVDEVSFNADGTMKITPTLEGVSAVKVDAEKSEPKFGGQAAAGQDEVEKLNARIDATAKSLKVNGIEEVRGNLTLPTEGALYKNVKISWKSSNPEIISDEEANGFAAGIVVRPAKTTDVKLIATISAEGTDYSVTKDFEAKVLATPVLEETTDYLFAYFTGEGYSNGEQIYFSGSHDGLNWTSLNSGNPVITSTLGDKGLRDPFIMRSHEGDKFYLIATDLKIYGNGNWGAAQTSGSQDIMVWESTDLVNWSEQRACHVAVDGAGCTWAPEAFWDEESQDYVVFWASKTSADNYGPHRIYKCHTRDFYTYSDAEVWIEFTDNSGNTKSVIDTTMIKVGDTYYRLSKNEEGSAVTDSLGKINGKSVFLEKSDSIDGTWTRIVSDSLNAETGVEGATSFKFNVDDAEGDQWCILLDNNGGVGYYPLVTSNLESGSFRKLSSSEYDFGARLRHGSVLNITANEYAALNAKWGTLAKESSDSAYADKTPAETLVAKYSFTADTADQTGNTKVTANGNVTTSEAGANFNGSSYLAITNNDGSAVMKNFSDEITISYLSDTKNSGSNCGWAVFASKNANTLIWQPADETYIGIMDKTDGFALERFNVARGNEDSTKLTTSGKSGQKRVTITMTATTVKIYFDGELKTELTNNKLAKLSDMFGDDSILYLGKALWGNSGEYYKGTIKDFELYSKALSQKEINDLYGFGSEEPADNSVQFVKVSTDKVKLTKGETAKVTATVLPESAENKAVTWTSSDEAVAAVSEDGVVSPVGNGYAVIRATAVANTKLYGEVEIKVSGIAPCDHKDTAEIVDGKFTCKSCGADLGDDYTGFAEKANGKYYFVEGIAQSGWQQVDGNWYYCETGYFLGRVRVGEHKIGYTTYTFDSNGILVRGGFRNYNGFTYYYWAGVYQTGWQTIDGNTYYFNENGSKGHMQTGIVEIDGKFYEFADNGILVGQCDAPNGFVKNTDGIFCYENGTVKTGWFEVDGKWYFGKTVAPNVGVLRTGVSKVNSVTYTFDENGVLVQGGFLVKDSGTTYYYFAGQKVKNSFVEHNGNTYYFDWLGRMKTGTVKVDGTTYTFDENGVRQ